MDAGSIAVPAVVTAAIVAAGIDRASVPAVVTAAIHDRSTVTGVTHRRAPCE